MSERVGMTDDAVRELLALAAVDALDAGEQADLDAVLATRPDLAAELDDLREATATMAVAVSDAPPPSLRGSVLAAVVAEPQLAPESAVVEHVAPVVPLRSRRRWLVGAVAAAAAAVVVVAGVVATQVFDDSTGDRVAAVLDDPDADVVLLEGQLAGLQLVYSPEHRDAVMVGADIPAPDGDQVYELWRIEDAAPARVDIFRPDDDGTVEVLMDDVTAPDDATFAITIEPAGGSDAPTSDIIAQS